MFVSFPAPISVPTVSGKLLRVDSVLGQGSTRNDMALPINSIQPAGVFIKAHIDRCEQKCLVDTGATMSLVSHQLVHGNLQPCSLKARGIGGEELHVLGMAELHPQLANETFAHSFVVVGMSNTCILGADFLKVGKMLVDVANAKLSYQVVRYHCWWKQRHRLSIS